MSHDRRVPLGRTRLGAGVLARRAGARSAGGTAADLLTWLRTPGRLADPEPADALEARVRRNAIRSARAAREVWETAARRPAADRARPRSPRPPPRGRRRCSPRSRRRRRRSGRRRTGAAPRCSRPEDLADARVAARPARRVLPSCAGWPRRPGAARRRRATCSTALAPVRGARSRRALSPGPSRGVLLADPLAIRARRFRAVFVCGLQDGEFPRRPAPEPFLSDEDRRALAVATGLRLPLHEDVLDRERSLFYAAVSRPEDVLFLSWRSSDEEGNPPAPSVFVDDVRALFDRHAVGGARHAAARRRHVGAARRADAARAAPRLRRGAQRPEPAPLGAPETDALLGAARRARHRAGARAGGVRRLRRPLADRAAPAPGPDRARSRADAARLARARRARAHAARCCASGRARRAIVPERLDAALAALRRRARRARRAAAVGRAAPRAAARARGRPGALPAHGGRARRRLRARRELEWSFGARATTRTARCRSATAAGAVTGRVDRIDAGPGGAAIVRDYKGRTGGRRREVGRRAAAAGRRSTCSPCASCSAASRSPGSTSRSRAASSRARGLVRDDVPGDYVAHRQGRRRRRSTRRSRPRARSRRGPPPTCTPGRSAPCPERCSNRGCRYPAICRAGEPTRRAAGMRGTPEQRAAIADRGRSSLLAAGRRLRQDRGDGRALRRGGAATTASRSARS